MKGEGIRLVGQLVERWFKWIILLPAVVLLLVTAGAPTLWLLVISLFEDNYLFGTFRFIGFDNYRWHLFNPSTWRYMLNTLIYVAGSVGIGFFIALGLAKILSTNVRFRTFWMIGLILPWIFPQIAGAIMWQWMLHHQYGVLNYLLLKAKLIEQFVPFLAQTLTAFVVLIWVDLWYWTPFALLVLFGGFTRIPTELMEAASIDGASAWQTFRQIEIPYILPEILAVLILRTMFTFREFGIPYLLGQGGPGRSTEVIGLTIYRESIQWLELGKGASLSVILLLMMALIAFAYFRVIKVDKSLQEGEAYE